MSRYIYAEAAYDTVSDVEAAVTAMKKRLDNNPTDWCVVKPVVKTKTINIDDKDIVAYEYGNPLSDTQIKALSSSDDVYNLFSVNDGYNYTAVSESDTVIGVQHMRKSYAKWLDVSKYYDTQVEEGQPLITHNVTNEDMSGYV